MTAVKGPLPEQSKLVLVAALASVASSAVTATAVWLWTRRKSTASAKCLQACSRPTVENANEKEEAPKKSSEIYDSEVSGQQYMEFHYTPTRTTYTQKLRTITESFDFPLRVAQKFKEFPPTTGREKTCALDIGCATGASVLEMSKCFGSVIGIDYSERFIHLAQEVLRRCTASPNAQISYVAPDQGNIQINRNTRLPHGIFPQRCKFFRGDAMNLFVGATTETPRPPSSYDDVAWYQVPQGELFDGVLAANLLCRVPDPRRLLDAFARLLHKGGVLVLASPYSWWEGASPSSKWIGGKPGGPRSEDAVKEILAKDFELLSETDEAFLIRDHTRRYQLGFSHCTVWRRR